ncbi:MAG: hypothetical protein P9L93_05090 [Candidatus Gorgyraea atricola]|nr:hypothetical protein [Candidatus Gorgyraea atricola]
MISRSGFTLLEVLIATVLFTVSTIVIIGLFGTGIIGGFDSENTSIAMNLAQQKMEEIRNLAFDDIVDEAKADVTGFSEFQREVDETESPTDLKTITVTVYRTYKGDEISVPITTYISRN